MRAAAIFGLGTSPALLKPFQEESVEWVEGLPASSSDADAILIFGGDGTIHRHLPALVRLQLPVLIVPSGSGNDFARAPRSAFEARFPASLARFRNQENPSAGEWMSAVIVQPSAPHRTHYFCTVAACGLDSAAARRAHEMPRWLRGHGGYALALLPLLLKLPASFHAPHSLEWHATRGNDSDVASKRTLLAAFANTQFYGDGMRIAPQADFADGQLDICLRSAR